MGFARRSCLPRHRGADAADAAVAGARRPMDEPALLAQRHVHSIGLAKNAGPMRAMGRHPCPML